METMWETSDFDRLRMVLTVPMRNGNKDLDDEAFKYAVGSYRTYEEWKPFIVRAIDTQFLCSYRTYEEWKLCWDCEDLARSFEFLPYLWGMETREGVNTWRQQRQVLTVPMRNGNPTFTDTTRSSCKSSYRTYEEWKLIKLPHEAKSPFGSYRTYEEWKLIWLKRLL